MTKRDHNIMTEADALQLHIESETEQFLCQTDRDSEWRLYGYEKDGTRKTRTYEVTEETPPDRSVILRNFDTDEEFVITWSVSVTKR